MPHEGHVVFIARPRILVATFFYAAIAPVAVAFGFLRTISSPSLRDFGSFWESGRAAAEGMNPYGIYPLTHAVSTPTFCGYDMNLNPPTMLPIFEALSHLSPVAAFRVWTALSVAAAIAIFALMLKTYRGQIDLQGILWFAALGPLWDTLYLGQSYLVLALASTGAWILLRNRSEAAAGILIGLLAAVKPNFLVWPALMLAAGHWRCAAFAALTSLSMVIASLALYGPEVWGQWFAVLALDGPRGVLPINGSVVGLLTRFNEPGAGKLLAGALLVGAAMWAWIHKPPALIVSALALALSLIASPLGWAHYAVFLVPVIFEWWKERDWTVYTSAWLLVIPLAFAGMADMTEWWQLATFGTMYTLIFTAISYTALRKHHHDEAYSNPGNMPRRHRGGAHATVM